MRIKIFADGADLASIRELMRNPVIAGFTTNPTLMRKAGITDYERFAREVIGIVNGLPVSFEVIADEPVKMIRQARRIADWGGTSNNVYVKIPVMTTTGCSTSYVIRDLVNEGIRLNITAITLLSQVSDAVAALGRFVPAYVSVFAGRVADTGLNPVPLMRKALTKLPPNVKLIWASPREVLNVVQADEIGCDIITVTPDILQKLPLIGRNLYDYSRETVEMFYRDAVASGLTL